MRFCILLFCLIVVSWTFIPHLSIFHWLSFKFQFPNFIYNGLSYVCTFCIFTKVVCIQTMIIQTNLKQAFAVIIHLQNTWCKHMWILQCPDIIHDEKCFRILKLSQLLIYLRAKAFIIHCKKNGIEFNISSSKSKLLKASLTLKQKTIIVLTLIFKS